MPLESDYLFNLKLEVEAMLDVENLPRGMRRVVSLSDGSVSGPEISGSILAPVRCSRTYSRMACY